MYTMITLLEYNICVGWWKTGKNNLPAFKYDWVIIVLVYNSMCGNHVF